MLRSINDVRMMSTTRDVSAAVDDVYRAVHGAVPRVSRRTRCPRGCSRGVILDLCRRATVLSSWPLPRCIIALISHCLLVVGE